MKSTAEPFAALMQMFRTWLIGEPCTGRYISDRVANNGEPQDTVTWFDCSEGEVCKLHGCDISEECRCPEPRIDLSDAP